MKKQLLFLVFVMLPLVASADAVEINGIYYNIIEKAKLAEVTENPNKYSGDVVIPEKISYGGNTYTVNSIGSFAFNCCYNMTSITIPASIVSIEYSAFENCIGLTSVHITDLAAWCNISYGMISPNPLQFAHHLFLNGEEVKDLVIPDNVSNIANSTFRGCSGLTSLTIPSNVTSIGDAAFWGCSGIKSLIIPSSVTSLGISAFAECTNLASISIPSSITIIDGAFSGCTSLTSVEIPNSVTQLSGFSGCTSLTTITIPSSVNTINNYAFNNCSSLKTIIIGTGVKETGYLAFAGCSELTDVYCYAENVPQTNNEAFNNSYIGYATLHVPAASISFYSSTAPWNGFGTIDAITSEDISIGDLGIGTFCGSNPLDLSGTEDVKAYVVSSYESATGQVTLTRTYYIPPFTGVVVKGNKGVHSIPAGVGQPVYPNMMKGVTTNTVLNKVNGDYTNYVLANKGGNLGFYAVSDGSTLGAGKAYLPLPTADLPTAARELTLIFDDGETTEIMKVASQEKASQGYYDLQGRRVANPTSGLYIVNGKKVIIK